MLTGGAVEEERGWIDDLRRIEPGEEREAVVESFLADKLASQPEPDDFAFEVIGALLPDPIGEGCGRHRRHAGRGRHDSQDRETARVDFGDRRHDDIEPVEGGIGSPLPPQSERRGALVRREARAFHPSDDRLLDLVVRGDPPACGLGELRSLAPVRRRGERVGGEVGRGCRRHDKGHHGLHQSYRPLPETPAERDRRRGDMVHGSFLILSDQ